MLSDIVDELKEVLEHQPAQRIRNKRKPCAKRRNRSGNLKGIVTS